MKNRPSRPSVLCLSGLDPTGGAGIQADIETMLMTGSHCLPVITSLTVQDTHNVRSSTRVQAELLTAQVQTLLEDVPICAIKIGLIDNPETVAVIGQILSEHQDIPIVADPVLKAGGGFDFGAADLAQAYRSLILPYVSVVTPNTEELRLLTPQSGSTEMAAQDLHDCGADHMLLTGTHATSADVINRLFCGKDEIGLWHWPRLPGEYHGSGCTLAAALASYLAQGLPMTDAAEKAQVFTWQALESAWPAGRGQLIPARHRI